MSRQYTTLPIANEDDPDVSIVMGAYRAYARGNIDKAVEHMSPDIEWIEPDDFPNGGRHTGPAAVAAYLRASKAMWKTIHSEPTPYRRGDNVIILHHVTGQMIDGSEQDVTVADVFTVKEGQIVHMQAYGDPSAAFS